MFYFLISTAVCLVWALSVLAWRAGKVSLMFRNGFKLAALAVLVIWNVSYGNILGAVVWAFALGEAEGLGLQRGK